MTHTASSVVGGSSGSGSSEGSSSDCSSSEGSSSDSLPVSSAFCCRVALAASAVGCATNIENLYVQSGYKYCSGHVPIVRTGC